MKGSDIVIGVPKLGLPGEYLIIWLRHKHEEFANNVIVNPSKKGEEINEVSGKN